MKMKRMLLLMVSMMAANSFAETNEMRGVWTTGPVLSQRGMVVTEKEFKADRNVSTRVKFLQIFRPRFSSCPRIS